MSFGLARGKELDPAPIGVTAAELPPLPDEVVSHPASAWLDPRRWFPHPERPLEIEIGCGKGTFLVQQAAVQPGTNFLGFEWAREFYLYAADRCRRHGFGNVRLAHTDASEFFRWRLPPAGHGGFGVRVVHLYFSDPWPKTRHHRRRVVQDRFLADCLRVLEPGGELRIVTDHEEYWEWMEEHFARWAGAVGATGVASAGTPGRAGEAGGAGPEPGKPFERLAFDRPESAGEGELVGTNFERKYREEGRPFHATVLRKPASPPERDGDGKRATDGTRTRDPQDHNPVL